MTDWRSVAKEFLESPFEDQIGSQFCSDDLKERIKKMVEEIVKLRGVVAQSPRSAPTQLFGNSEGSEMSDRKLFEKLRNLLDAGSHGPWHIGHVSETDEAVDLCSSDGVDIGTIENRVDQSLVCEIRNSLPKLLEAIDVMQEALKCVWSHGETAGDLKEKVAHALVKVKELGG